MAEEPGSRDGARTRRSPRGVPRDVVAGAGPALFQVVRFWSRRWAAQASGPVSKEQRRIQDIMVLDAVHAAGRSRDEVAVTDVADQLGIDRSGASRLVAEAATRGLLTRSTSTQDSRRSVVTVTSSGDALLASARAWQEDAYARLTATWDRADAERFAGYLRRLAAELSPPPAATVPPSNPSEPGPNT